MAMDRISPNHAALKRTPPVQELPQLKQFSDVASIFWFREAVGEQIRNIRYFFSLMINNKQTQSIIVRALQKVGKTLQPWPGHTLRSDSEEYSAILGMEPTLRRFSRINQGFRHAQCSGSGLFSCAAQGSARKQVHLCYPNLCWQYLEQTSFPAFSH